MVYYDATQPRWPMMRCDQCGREMKVVEHEAQHIAEQVKRIYQCECGNKQGLFVDVVTGEYRTAIC